MKTTLLGCVGAMALAITGAQAGAQSPTPAASAGKPAADLSSYVRSLTIPYRMFTLPNGLRVLVNTDRTKPMVSINIFYDIGSKHEPKGRTGFAHLFEHLMFAGSENTPPNYMKAIEDAGASLANGSTTSDFTTYYEIMPVGALERALFMESDRMGHLLGTITRRKLDEQRGVVQNEKRQADNSSYGLVRYRLRSALYPPDHPYGHEVIGSMADLDAASLDDVKNWFRDHYGPNNAVIALSGDIDEATARRLVTRYFGDIPAGPRTVSPVAPVPTLPRDVDDTMTDRVAAPMIVRAWTTPGDLDPDHAALATAAVTLGGVETSLLQEKLVRGEKLFSDLGVDLDGATQAGMFTIKGVVAEGVDPAVAGRRLDVVVAEYLKSGPSADSLQRYVAQTLSNKLSTLDSNGYRARTLAMGELLAGDPERSTKQLAATVAQTPATVRAAAAKWLGRPVYRLTVMPGVRTDTDQAAPPAAAPAVAGSGNEGVAKGTRGPMPAIVPPVETIRFPPVRHVRLKNGMEVVYAQVARAPMTLASLAFDAGIAAEVPGRAGTERLTVDMLKQGAGTMDASTIAGEQERLGATLGVGISPDRTIIDLTVPSVNFPRALDLLADVTRRPTFADAEIARKRAELLAQIQQELAEGSSGRLLALLANPRSPYANGGGSGDPDVVATLTRADLLAYYQAWFRPDKAKLFIVSDRPLAELRPLLERAYGDWTATGPAGAKVFPAEIPGRQDSRIVLVDTPGAPQSQIAAVVSTPLKAKIPMHDAQIANDALGGSFASRINTDLRETRHWTYGASSSFIARREGVDFIMLAPVQSDRTGDALGVMRDHLARFVTTDPMTQEEFDRAVDANVKSALSSNSSANEILDAMMNNDTYDRSDDYATTIPALYRGLTLDRVRSAFRAAVDPGAVTWLVVGDAAEVRPQLGALSLPIVEMTPLGTVR